MPNPFHFVKSSASNDTEACVEVASNVVGVRAIRDSQDPHGPHLTVTPAVFTRFLDAVKSGYYGTGLGR